MTDPVTAAIITTSGAILVGLITAFVHSRKTHSASQPAPNTLPADATPKTIQSQRSEVAIFPPVQVPADTTDLSHLEIVENIERVPPYQKSAVERTFIGLRVHWHAQLDDIYHHGDGSLTVQVSLSDRSSASCDTRPEDVHGLHAAPKGTPVIVNGLLKQISRYHVRLLECVISKSNGNA